MFLKNRKTVFYLDHPNKSAEQCERYWKGSIKQKFPQRKNSKIRLPSWPGPKPLDILEEEVVNFILVADIVDGDGKTVETPHEVSVDNVMCIEAEYLDDDIIVVSASTIDALKCAKNINKRPLNSPRGKRAKNLQHSKEPMHSVLEKAKKACEDRLSNQERYMADVKEELQHIKEGQQRTNELLEKILLAINNKNSRKL